ncbi:Tbingi protein [Trypanosoma cruzi]|nr:Tbingi protein [Trypanosoma cruzi]
MINLTPQDGLSAVAERTGEYFTEANASKTKYTVLFISNTASLHLAYEGASATVERVPTLLGVNFRNFCGMGARVAKLHEESNQRLLHLAAILFIVRGTK